MDIKPTFEKEANAQNFLMILKYPFYREWKQYLSKKKMHTIFSACYKDLSPSLHVGSNFQLLNKNFHFWKCHAIYKWTLNQYLRNGSKCGKVALTCFLTTHSTESGNNICPNRMHLKYFHLHIEICPLFYTWETTFSC